MLNNQCLENAFSFFDRVFYLFIEDHHGFITLDEIKQYLNDSDKNCK
jgi:hypothetical protein